MTECWPQLLLRDAPVVELEQRASGMAARLASVRDLDGLLEDVAGQARALLRTDITCLALLEGDSLCIRYFDGTLSPTVPPAPPADEPQRSRDVPEGAR